MSEVERFSVGVDGVDPNGSLVRYVDYIALEQRAEAAEAALAEEKRITSKLIQDRAMMARECNAFEEKLAELGKQEPVVWCNENDLSLMVNKRMIGGMMTVRHHGERPLFTRPAPSINLAELVPDEKKEEHFEFHRWAEKAMHIREVKGWNDCCAAILRKIKEKSK